MYWTHEIETCKSNFKFISTLKLKKKKVILMKNSCLKKKRKRKWDETKNMRRAHELLGSSKNVAGWSFFDLRMC